MQPVFAQRLSLGQLDLDPDLVLGRPHDRVTALPLGSRHVRAESVDVVDVRYTPVDKPGVDRDHHQNGDAERENEPWVGAPKIAPRMTPPITLMRAVRSSSSQQITAQRISRRIAHSVPAMVFMVTEKSSAIAPHRAIHWFEGKGSRTMHP